MRNAVNCQSNPPTPVVIELGEALGERMPVDAAWLPYLNVREVDPRGW